MTIPADLLYFPSLCTHPKTCAVCCSSVFCSFHLVFASPRDHTPYCTHPNRSVPIITHSWHFSPNRPKHDVRGNFPGHRAQILSCDTVNAPCLPCFFVSYVPRVPTHPSAPIYTHLYLFVPVRTHNWCVYMCNLIKKYTLNNVYFKIFVLVSSY